MRLCAILLALVSFTSTRSEACTCALPGPPCESMFSSTVFVGTATNVKQDINLETYLLKNS